MCDNHSEMGKSSGFIQSNISAKLPNIPLFNDETCNPSEINLINNNKKVSDSPISSIDNLTKTRNKTILVRPKIHHILENTFSSPKNLFQPTESLTEMKISD